MALKKHTSTGFQPILALVRLVRSGSECDDFELLSKVCLDVGIASKFKGNDSDSVLEILASIPADDLEFMPYLRRHGTRLLAYLADDKYGDTVEGRWKNAKKNDLADANYDDANTNCALDFSLVSLTESATLSTITAFSLKFFSKKSCIDEYLVQTANSQ